MTEQDGPKRQPVGYGVPLFFAAWLGSLAQAGATAYEDARLMIFIGLMVVLGYLANVLNNRR